MFTPVVSAVVLLTATVLARPQTQCIPHERNPFLWKNCSDEHFPQKVQITGAEAYQGYPLTKVSDKGGLDLTSPLITKFDVTVTYGKPMTDHEFDFHLFAYDYIEEKKACDWYEVETAGALEGIECKKMIDHNCEYVNIRHVTAKVDWKERVGELLSALQPNNYYAFKVIERNGHDKLNCIWMQTKVIKVE